MTTFITLLLIWLNAGHYNQLAKDWNDLTSDGACGRALLAIAISSFSLILILNLKNIL